MNEGLPSQSLAHPDANATNETPSSGDPQPQRLTFNSPPIQIPDHELLRRIGSGSYGEVWLARNIVGTLRAVKVVHRQTFERAEHFEREFKGLQKFEPISRSHEGLVDILQIGRNDAAGYFYYVMELADDGGEMQKEEGRLKNGSLPTDTSVSSFCIHPSYFPKTLRRELHQRGRLPVNECIDIGLALASALEHLHKHGLVHRDIKPSNIIFVNGAPKLADIGLVAHIDDARSLVGTAGYIPPEGPGTPQADLYSLGKVLYEISFGKDRQDFPQLPPDLQSHPDHAAVLELNEVILKACETDFRKRFQTAQQMHDDLVLLQRGRSVRRQRTAQRRFGIAKRIMVAVAAMGVATLFGYAFMKTFLPDRQGQKPDAQAKRPADPRGTTNQEAWAACQMGRFHLNKLTPDRAKKAGDYFLQAIQLDANFVEAYAGLADCYLWDPNYRTKGHQSKVRVIAAKLLELDDSRAEGHTLKAMLAFEEWRWAEAETGFQHAIALNERYAPAHALYGLLLAYATRFDEATRQLQRAEQLEPTSVGVKVHLGFPLYGAGRFDEAIAQFKEALDMEPSSFQAHLALAWAYEAKGEFLNAIKHWERVDIMMGVDRQKAAHGAEALRRATRDAGAKGYWQSILPGMSVPDPWPEGIAAVYACLGEKEKALDELERAVAAKNLEMMRLKYNCVFHYDSLREEPRFIELLRRVGLEK